MTALWRCSGSRACCEAGVQGLWALHFTPEGVPAGEGLDWHAFLLISLGSESKVLRTGEELDELQPADVGFALNSRTVHAGNLLGCSRIVQACLPWPPLSVLKRQALR